MESKLIKRLAVVAALAVPVVVAAVDYPYIGTIIASTSGARNQADTATPFQINGSRCVIVDCVNDAGTAANAFIRWSNTWTDAGSVTRQNWTRMTNYVEKTCGQSGTGTNIYQVLSIMGNTEPVFCHVTETSP